MATHKIVVDITNNVGIIESVTLYLDSHKTMRETYRMLENNPNVYKIISYGELNILYSTEEAMNRINALVSV